MKTKKLNKKLSLNKTTVTSLETGAMNRVLAGDIKTSYFPCVVSECIGCNTLHFTNCLPCPTVGQYTCPETCYASSPPNTPC